jgi:hypothetical protein
MAHHIRRRLVRLTSVATGCCLLMGCHVLPGSHPEPVRNLSALTSIHSIYVTELRENDSSNLIEGSIRVRETIQAELARSERFTVVQDPAQADAVLGGLAGVERWYHGME